MTNIDLNLLRVFEVLYEEGNVTRAAGRLHLTQSAVSHALARLRTMLGDPLFVRIPSGLQPTERAHQVAPRLRTALAEVRSMVATPTFDPATTSRRFTIAAGAYFCAVIIQLIAIARRSAPNISLQVIDIGVNLTQALDQGQVDVVLGAFDKVPSRFRWEMLFRDELVWVIGADHPLASQPFDHAAFLSWPRLGIASTLVPGGAREQPARDDIVRHAILEASGTASLPALTKWASMPVMVCDAPTAVAAAAATDMVALAPRHYAETCASSARIRTFDLPPQHADTIDISMLWHSRTHDDPGSSWLRTAIREAAGLNTGVAELQTAAQ